jgi:hypothetical protein
MLPGAGDQLIKTAMENWDYQPGLHRILKPARLLI